jgi:hypothetical protein
MTRCGVAFPNVVDLVTRNDDVFTLVVAEAQPLVAEDAIALQEKLNTYLTFALDGELTKRYAESSGRALEIRVELYAQPDRFILEFLSRYAGAMVEHGIALSVLVNGENVP